MRRRKANGCGAVVAAACVDALLFTVADSVAKVNLIFMYQIISRQITHLADCWLMAHYHCRPHLHRRPRRLRLHLQLYSDLCATVVVWLSLRHFLPVDSGQHDLSKAHHI